MWSYIGNGKEPPRQTFTDKKIICVFYMSFFKKWIWSCIRNGREPPRPIFTEKKIICVLWHVLTYFDTRGRCPVARAPEAECCSPQTPDLESSTRPPLCWQGTPWHTSSWCPWSRTCRKGPEPALKTWGKNVNWGFYFSHKGAKEENTWRFISSTDLHQPMRFNTVPGKWWERA